MNKGSFLEIPTLFNTQKDAKHLSLQRFEFLKYLKIYTVRQDALKTSKVITTIRLTS